MDLPVGVIQLKKSQSWDHPNVPGTSIFLIFLLNALFGTVFVWSGLSLREDQQQLGGGFKDSLFSPLFGEDSHFDKYFSNGLKHHLVYLPTNLP